MKKQELSPLPLIRPYHKEGIALHAEQTVQALLDRPEDIPDIVKHSNDVIDEHYNSSITGEYKKAGWRLNIGLAAIGHLVAQESFLPILDCYHKYGVPYRPDGRFEAYSYTSSDVIKDAHKNSYWLQAHTYRLFEQIRRTNNPYHSLYRYYNDADEQHHVWQSDWCAGPGKNRWPVYNSKREFDARERLARVFRLNSTIAVNLLCTKAIHHLIHKNPEADSDELYQAAMHSTEQISWQTTGNRHYGWTPDWRERRENNEPPPGTTPDDGLEALVVTPPSKLTQPNGYVSSVSGPAIMLEPDFCLHEALRDGPVAKAGLCGGNIFIRPTDCDALDTARSFFGTLYMDRKNGESYSLAGIALAMAGATLKDTVLPIYEANKEAEAAKNLHG